MKKTEPNKIKRRNFLGTTATAVAGFTIVPNHAVSALGHIANKDSVRNYLPPDGEVLNEAYKVTGNGKIVPVYNAKVKPSDWEKYSFANTGIRRLEFPEISAFAYFDMDGKVNVKVEIAHAVNSAKILPTSAGIIPKIEGKVISFEVISPQNLVIEINGEWIRSLQLFCNPIEKEKPAFNDSNVIYFGPGIHEVINIEVTDNQILYIAGGAIIKGIIQPDTNKPKPIIELRGNNIKVCGRGIVDGSIGKKPEYNRHMIAVKGNNIKIEGVILRDSPHWTMPIRESENVLVENVKIIGHRGGSDGIDVVNSRYVKIRGCYIRSADDLIVVKTHRFSKGKAEHIVAEDCVLWNVVAHALSIGAEITDDIDDVVFKNCDVIHDTGREWTLRVYHSDAAKVSNVRFENIRIEESKRLISLWIDKSFWSHDPERGHISNVTFKHVKASGNPLTIELKGFDDNHAIENVLFENVWVNGKSLEKDMVKYNAFVRNISIK